MAAAFLLVVLAIPMIAIGLAIRATSPGPALYRHTRIGEGGRPFTMLKFRTMVANADDLLVELLGANENDGMMFKPTTTARDPDRKSVAQVITGRAPQLVNVFWVTCHWSARGHPAERGRGIWGLGTSPAARATRHDGALAGQRPIHAQLGRDAASDLRYVDNWTFSTDLRLLWQTVSVVIRGTGAY